MINKRISVIVFLALTAPFYFGQSNVPVIKSPQTYTIEKFGNIPVSLNTGSVTYDLNLFSYEDLYRGTNYDIGLQYYGTGFVPSKKSNYVGLDWSLDIGGAISREVRGLPDDFFSDWPQSSNNLYGYLEGVKTANKINYDIYNQNYNMLSSGSGGIGIKTGTYSFEIEPDKFSFNFMGNSGYFFIGNDGRPIIVSDNKNLKIDVSQLSSKQPLNPKLTNGSECLTTPTTIIITDEKGIKYYFGGNYENLEISYNLLPQQASENRFTITAWNLYKVEYPNSNILEIQYRVENADLLDRNFCVDRDIITWMKEPFLLMFDNNMISKQEISSANYNYNTFSKILKFDGTIYWGSTSSYTSGVTNSHSATKKSFPSSITLNGKNIVAFDFERFEKSASYNIPSLRLRNIKFYDITGNHIVKEVNLDYYRHEDHFFLDTIKMFKKAHPSLDFEQQYSFDYYDKSTLPDETSVLVDYWGYFNNKPRMNMFPDFTIDKDTGDFTITDNTREADPSLCSTSLLKTITYPTGGKSEFIYEPHDYSKRIDRNSFSEFKNILIPSEGIVSGGRISKIINYSNDGSPIGTKEYKYTSNYSPSGVNTKSSGILSSFYRNVIYGKVQTDFSTYEELNAYSDNFIETAMNSFPVQYSEVTEIDNHNGFTKYYFTDQNMYPDSPVYKSVDNNLSIINTNYFPPNMANINLPYRSNNYKRGKLYKQEVYDQNFIKLRSSDTEFIDVSEVLPGNFATYVADRLRTKYFFKLFGGSFSPGQTISNDILDSKVLSSKSEYFYNGANKVSLSKLKNTDTHGKITETYYQYAHDKGNQKLIDANIIDTPLEVGVLEKQDINTTGKITSQTETKYDNPGNIYPSSIISYDLKTPTISSTEITYDLYDSKGNLQQYTTKNGVSTVLIWGYNGTKLIAKVEGAILREISQSQINNIVTASDTDALAPGNNDESSFLSVLNSFRMTLPGFQVTTYTYDPQIGVRSITPPSGVRENYLYDTAHRLEKVIDANGKTVKEMKYNYKN